MKKFVSTAIIIMMLFSFCATAIAAEPATDNAAAVLDTNTTYTLKQLQEIAVRCSRQALVDDVDIKKKEMAVRTVRSDITAMSDDILSITKPMDVKLELDVAKKTRQDHLNQLKVDVYKTVLNIRLSEEKIKLQEEKGKMADEKLEMAKARFKAATITQEELDSAQYSCDSKRVDLSNAREALNSLYLDLRSMLNQPLNTIPVKIAVDLKLESFDDLDVDFALNNLYKTETAVYKATGKLDIAQKAMDIAAGSYRQGDLTYDNSELDLEAAGLDLSGAKTALDSKVKNAYNEMVNKYDNVELAEKYAKLAAKKLANAKLKYDRGVLSKEEYMSAKENSLDAEYAKLSAFAEYNSVKAEFNNMLGI